MWRQEAGVSPHQWLLTARVNHALELLEVTDLGIEQIAAQSGLGTTPTAYRRAFQRTTGPRAGTRR